MRGDEKERLAYTIDDFAKAIGIGRSKVYEEIRLGRLRAKKLGARTVITGTDARAYLDSLPDAKENPTPVAAHAVLIKNKGFSPSNT